MTGLLNGTPTLDDQLHRSSTTEDDIMRRIACANGWLVDGDRGLHSRGVP
jgi:hypothetical protein